MALRGRVQSSVDWPLVCPPARKRQAPPRERADARGVTLDELIAGTRAARAIARRTRTAPGRRSFRFVPSPPATRCLPRTVSRVTRRWPRRQRRREAETGCRIFGSASSPREAPGAEACLTSARWAVPSRDCAVGRHRIRGPPRRPRTPNRSRPSCTRAGQSTPPSCFSMEKAFQARDSIVSGWRRPLRVCWGEQARKETCG